MPENTSFCPSCGAKITPLSLQTQQTSAAPAYPAVGIPPAIPHGHGIYKATIGMLLIIIILLGIAWYASGSLGLLGGYRYQLTNPPNAQSIQPPSTPTLVPTSSDTIWNSCGSNPGSGCNMSANGWREGTVPDTYDYFVSFTGNTPVGVYFFTMGQFVQFATCNGDVNCVSGRFLAISPTRSIQRSVFKLAEGCADYIAVYVSQGTGVMNPDVAAVKNPTMYSTGYCAQTGA